MSPMRAAAAAATNFFIALLQFAWFDIDRGLPAMRVAAILRARPVHLQLLCSFHFSSWPMALAKSGTLQRSASAASTGPSAAQPALATQAPDGLGDRDRVPRPMIRHSTHHADEGDHYGATVPGCRRRGAQVPPRTLRPGTAAPGPC